MTKAQIIEEISRLDPEESTSGTTQILRARLDELRSLYEAGFVRADGHPRKWWPGDGSMLDRASAVARVGS
jgi:hypothetical protein